TASAVRPLDGVALGLRRDDLRLEAGQQQLPFGQGQPSVGDITEIIRPVDLQDVGALSLTVSPGFHQPHNPSHAPTPDQRSDAKLPLRRPHPQSPGSPDELATRNGPTINRTRRVGRSVLVLFRALRYPAACTTRPNPSRLPTRPTLPPPSPSHCDIRAASASTTRTRSWPRSSPPDLWAILNEPGLS